MSLETKPIEELKDKNGVVLKVGDTVIHNGKEFICKYSENLSMYILRIKDDKGMNWRDMDWFKRCGKYCEITSH